MLGRSLFCCPSSPNKIGIVQVISHFLSTTQTQHHYIHTTTLPQHTCQTHHLNPSNRGVCNLNYINIFHFRSNIAIFITLYYLKMKKVLLTTFLLLLQLTVLGNVKWQRYIDNYDRQQYGANIQNWMMKRSSKGWIYAANNDGLLEFDGALWSLYPVKGKNVRSLNIVQDTVYVGSSSEFGYFESDQLGQLHYKSLSDSIELWGGEVWFVLESGKKIHFISDVDIHTYHREKKTIERIPSDSKINSALVHHSRLYLGRDDGLYCLNKGKLDYVEESKEIASGKIVEILPYGKHLLLVTAERGLYTYIDGKFSRLSTVADRFISENRLFCAATDGKNLALGSVQSGLLIFNLKNNSDPEQYNINNGLYNNTVLSVWFDNQNNLLLALDNGLAVINLGSAYRPLFANISPIGSGYCSAMFNGELYFGTNQGLYRYNSNQKPEMVNNIQGQIWSLAVIENTLFCCGDNGIYLFSKEAGAYTIPHTGVWEVIQIDDTTAVAGRYTGLSVLKLKGNVWRYSHDVDGYFDSTRGFVKEGEGNTFWFIKSNNTVCRLRVDSQMRAAKELKEYEIEESKIGSNFFVRHIHDKVVICTDDGIFGYSNLTDSFSHYQELENLLGNSPPYTHLLADQENNIWYYDNNGLSTLHYVRGAYSERPLYWGLRNELIVSHNNITLIDPTTAVVATGNGFVKLNLNLVEVREHSKAYIRKVVDSRSSQVLSYGRNQEPLKISYKDNAIWIQFAAANPDSRNRAHYSYKLSGVDEKWSTPSPIFVKEYTNLREGDYKFSVRPQLNSSGEMGESSTFYFSVLPPWYRSKWAYVVYSLLAAGAIYFVYLKTIRRQQLIITKQQEEKKVKDEKIYELQNEKLKSELQFKSQELAGYILNMGRKNSMLEEVKRSAQGLSKAIESKKYDRLRGLSSQLIKLIDKNLVHDDDFKAFQSNFDIVHKDFFSKLDEQFPELTLNDKMLCAYIKMGLTSKEIAPIQGISVRSVEVSRYRLRKKLELESGVNLNNFLQSI